MVWWGARNGRRNGASRRRLVQLDTSAASNASLSLIGGRIEGRRLAASGGCDRERPPQAWLAAKITAIGCVLVYLALQRLGLRSECLALPSDDAGDRTKVVERDDLDALDQGGFAAVLRRDHDFTTTLLGCVPGEGDGAGDLSKRPVERQLADDRHLGQGPRGDLPGCFEKGDGDREVQARTRLFAGGRRDVDDDASQGKLEAGVDERGPDPLPGLPHRHLWKPDNLEGRKEGPCRRRPRSSRSGARSRLGQKSVLSKACDVSFSCRGLVRGPARAGRGDRQAGRGSSARRAGRNRDAGPAGWMDD